MTSSTQARGAAKWALLSLAIGSFGIGMTEFVVMGLLPDIAIGMLPTVWATSQEDAIAQAGWLITLYALGVVVGAPTIAGSVAKYPRHRVMIGLALALTVFNALTFLLPTFELVAASRFLAGLPHGAYFGIGALVAADVLGPGKRAQGVSFVLTGLTVANVVGVPLGTYLGQQVGWRAAFMVVTAIFALATVCIALFVPQHPGDPGRTLRKELKVFRISQVWLALGVGAIGFGGFFAVYSYVAPMVTEIAGSPEWVVPIILILMGLGMTIGNLIGGRLADVDLKRTLIGGLVCLAIVLALVALTAHWVYILALLRVRDRPRVIGAQPDDPDATDGCRGRQPVDRRSAQPLGAEHRQRARRVPRRRGDRGRLGLRGSGVGGRSARAGRAGHRAVEPGTRALARRARRVAMTRRSLRRRRLTGVGDGEPSGRTGRA